MFDQEADREMQQQDDPESVHPDDSQDENPLTNQPPRYKVLSTRTPIKGFHPTHATILDTNTGKTYDWNSRKHRKLRQPVDLSQTQHHFPRFITCEYHIITWWLNLTNEVANIFWTISGVFATWPSRHENASARTVYVCGIVAGIFMILSCYCAYVEAINHSHADIRLPDKKKHRRFQAARRIYGTFASPLGQNKQLDAQKRDQLLRAGYPIIESCQTGQICQTEQLITTTLLDQAVAQFANNRQHWQTIKLNVRSSSYILTTQALHGAPVKTNDDNTHRSPYLWWTWTPALDHLGVLCAWVSFWSALVYLIPMVLEYPLRNASTGVVLFFVDILQILPYLCFVACGHVYIVEAAGSWWRPKWDSIGWWIAFLNTVGAYGFLLCGALAIPTTVGSTCCPHMARWGSALACFWGSCFYLLGGILMIIEFANPEPIVFGGTTAKGQ